MKRKNGLSGTEVPRRREPCGRTAAIDQVKFAINQPTETGGFVRSEDTRRRNFFQLFFEIFSELNGRERLADGVLAFILSLVTYKFGRIHAERTNINITWSVGTHTAICGDHANRSEIFRVRRRTRPGSADVAFSDVHVCARTEQQAGSNSDKRFHNFLAPPPALPRERTDSVASVLQLSCRRSRKMRGPAPLNASGVAAPVIKEIFIRCGQADPRFGRG